MKQRLKLIFAMMFLLSFNSCIRFEDGPCISFKSKEERLQGQWLLKYFTVDGVDSLQFYNNYYGKECIFDFQPFLTKDAFHALYHLNWGETTNNFYNATGFYGGINKNGYIDINNYIDFSATAVKPLWFLAHDDLCSGCGSPIWPISRLKYKEIWLKLQVSDKEYELHLENINKY